MKYPTQLGTLVAIMTGFLITSVCPAMLEARIGDRRESLEQRLFASGGILYRDDELQTNRRKVMPYVQYLDYLSSNTQVRIYFKTSDGRQPNSTELEEKRSLSGWDLHVVYANGVSIIEVYKRSQGMSEHELNHLLARQAGGSFWKRQVKSTQEDEEDEEEVVSAFGFDLVRDDGKVRAKKMGSDSIMFVDAQVDIKLAELNTSDLMQKAPVSVSGF
jgi:hypothetical protein